MFRKEGEHRCWSVGGTEPKATCDFEADISEDNNTFCQVVP